MRLFSNRQDNTTNSQLPNARIEMGWGAITTTASNSQQKAVTFQTPFNSPPIVFCNFGGDASGISTTYGAGVAAFRNASGSAQGISATGFTGRVTDLDGGNWAANNTVFFQWIAIGN
jgi:hypothetical protein